MNLRNLNQVIFQMQVWQKIPICLITLALSAARIFQHIALICVLCSKTAYYVYRPYVVCRHGIDSTYSLSRIIVEGVTHIAVFAWSESYFVKVVPIYSILLIRFCTCSTVKGIFVEKRVSFLVPIHTPYLQNQIIYWAVCQIEISCPVPI